MRCDASAPAQAEPFAGRACAIALAARGATLVLVDVVDAALQETVGMLKKGANAQVSTHVVDITDEKAIIELVQSIPKKYGRLDYALSVYHSFLDGLQVTPPIGTAPASSVASAVRWPTRIRKTTTGSLTCIVSLSLRFLGRSPLQINVRAQGVMMKVRGIATDFQAH